MGEKRIEKCEFYTLCIFHRGYRIIRVKYNDGDFYEDLASLDNSIMDVNSNEFVGLTKKEALKLIFKKRADFYGGMIRD